MTVLPDLSADEHRCGHRHVLDVIDQQLVWLSIRSPHIRHSTRQRPALPPGADDALVGPVHGHRLAWSSQAGHVFVGRTSEDIDLVARLDLAQLGSRSTPSPRGELKPLLSVALDDVGQRFLARGVRVVKVLPQIDHQP